MSCKMLCILSISLQSSLNCSRLSYKCRVSLLSCLSSVVISTWMKHQEYLELELLATETGLHWGYSRISTTDRLSAFHSEGWSMTLGIQLYFQQVMNPDVPQRRTKGNKLVASRLQSKVTTPKTHSRQPSSGIKIPSFNQALDEKHKKAYKCLGKTSIKPKVKETTEAVYSLYFGKVQPLKPLKQKVKRAAKSRHPRHLQYYEAADQQSRKAKIITDKLSSSQKSLKRPFTSIPALITFQCKSQQTLKAIHTTIQSVLHQSPLVVQNIVKSVQISLSEGGGDVCAWSGGSTKPFVHDTPKELECMEHYQNVNSRQLQISSSFLEVNNELDFVLETIGESKKQQCNIGVDYFRSQTQVTPKMRAQIVDWLQSLSEEIYIRRQTFHLAVEYLDMYLLIRPIQKNQLQLVAIASLMVAYSFQQKVPVGFVQIFESERPNGFTKQQILAMQVKLAMTLQFKFTVFTLAYWANLFTDQWDKFVSQPRVLGFSIIQENRVLAHSVLIFKQKNLELFNYVTTLIDTVMLSVEYHQLHKHQLVLAALYLSLRVKVDAIIYNDSNPVSGFAERYKKSNNPIFLDKHGFNQLFWEYLNQFGLQLSDLVCSCKHVFKTLGVLEFPCRGDADEVGVQHYNRYSLFYVTNKF